MFNPGQQQPSSFPFLDVIEQRIHPAVSFVLAAVGTVGGYFYGLTHPGLPLALYVALGLILGLLLIVLLKSLTAFLIYAALIIAAAFGTYWLCSNDTALRREHKAQIATPAPASPAATTRSLIDDLRKAVQQ